MKYQGSGVESRPEAIEGTMYLETEGMEDIQMK